MLPKEGDPVLVQAITGKSGRLHTRLMLDYGTNVAAGVTPGKKGESVESVPVYETVGEAVEKTGAKASVLFVPAANCYSAAEEALRAGVKLLVAITEHIPIRDTLNMLELARKKGAQIVGPNTPGLIVPSERAKLGIMPATSFREGKVALFSRSGTLMYEVANQLSSSGFGQSLALGVGGDPINCTTMNECIDLAAKHDDTSAVVIVGEIGGDAEERLARHMIDIRFRKKVVAYIAGRHAPKEKRMGHAGAIIYGNFGTAESKIDAMREAGALMAMTPTEIPALLKKA
jgi:succinyl-CoA synthetase alpha subunit